MSKEEEHLAYICKGKRYFVEVNEDLDSIPFQNIVSALYQHQDKSEKSRSGSNHRLGKTSSDLKLDNVLSNSDQFSKIIMISE